jgi:GPH family glycoside/pentoside/hexuronide:cation symporter
MKLRWREKIGYGLGDTASNFYWKSFEFFLLIFYTDVFGLDAGTAGTMFAVTRIFDALIDPVMGTLADRTRSRWGRFRPYLLWMAVPLAVTGVLAFVTPTLRNEGKVLYAYATYILVMVAYTAINIPYSALLGVVTSAGAERTSLSSLRFIGGFTGGILVVWLTPTLVAHLGGGNAQRGWPLTMAVWGAVAVALFFVCFATTRERVEPPARQQANLARELRDLFANRPWLVLGLLSLVTLTAFTIRSQTTAYYFKYYVKDERLLGTFLGSGMVAAIAGIALTAPATRLLGGKKPLFALLMAASGGLTLLFHFVPSDARRAMLALNAVTCFLQGASSPLLWAMYADTADHGEWQNGRRNTGLVFSAATMAQKGGGALAGLLNGLLLETFGYTANLAQSARSLAGIRATMSLIPGALCLLAALTMWLYRLDEPLMRTIERELRARRARAGTD